MIDYTNELTRPGSMLVRGSADPVTWCGQRALRLSGLALIPDLDVANGVIEVQVGAEGPCYPGVAFRAQDVANYELAYAQPHTSGEWDALQYDPVFHDSNTWQLFSGPAYQQACDVPLNEWFDLRVEFQRDRASICVGDQEPLVVRRLAHSRRTGLVGLWTYRPAYFAGLRVSVNPSLGGDNASVPLGTAGSVDEWYLDGYGVVHCEPGGPLLLNRYLPTAAGEARLLRQFDLRAAGPLVISFGFSDELVLELDGEQIFSGEHLWDPAGGYAGRGYVEPDAHSVRLDASAGPHRLAARVKVAESFGWGLALTLRSDVLRMSPARLTL